MKKAVFFVGVLGGSIFLILQISCQKNKANKY